MNQAARFGAASFLQWGCRMSQVRTVWRLGLVIFAVAFCIVVATIATHWPFRKQNVLQSLGHATRCITEVQQLSRFYFPKPGCRMQNVVFRRGQSTLAHVREVTMQSSWLNLLTFTRRLDVLKVEGLAVTIPPRVPEPEPAPRAAKASAIDELIADGAVLDIAQHSPTDPTLEFRFHHLKLRNVAPDKSIGIVADLHNPKPGAELHVVANFGPWKRGKTPTSGTYRLDKGELSNFQGIAGTLSSSGHFDGALEKLRMQGKVDVPNFEISANHHPAPLHAEYKALVDALTGDTSFEELQATLQQAALSVRGRIEGEHKTATLDFEAQRVRIEQILYLFTSSPVPPLYGTGTLRAHVVLPPPPGKFLKRLQLSGNFQIDRARFGNPKTQADIDRFSTRARGGKDDSIERVTGSLAGHVVVRNGAATLSNWTASLPGVAVRLDGYEDLLSRRVDIKGTVFTEASLSQDVGGGGLKSFLIKPLDPLFRKRPKGAKIPISITGYYPRANYHFSLHRANADN